MFALVACEDQSTARMESAAQPIPKQEAMGPVAPVGNISVENQPLSEAERMEKSLATVEEQMGIQQLPCQS